MCGVPVLLLCSGRCGLSAELIRSVCWHACHFFDDELTNIHFRIKHDFHAAQIDDFKRDRSAKAGVDRRCGEVNQQTAAGEGTFSLDAGT